VWHGRRSIALPEAGIPQRREGRREAGCLLAITLLTTFLFANGALDIAVARAFYHTEPLDHWPLAHQLPWSLLYRAAPWATATLVVTGLLGLALGYSRARADWRQAAVLVLLGVAVGPGLLANAIFKDHWQHPRPRDLIEFSGPLHYVPSPLIGTEGGASFPCGHCSVGFMFAAGWWIWRRRGAWAAASLTGGLALGLLLGLGRMAAGAHFFSDIVWSALLAFGVLHILWYYLLPAPAADEAVVDRAGRWRRVSAAVAALAGAAVLLALFATPHGTALTERVPLHSGSPRLLEVAADTANVTVVLLDGADSELTVDGELHGFGVPGSRLAARVEVLSEPHPALRYRIESRGWLTDVDGMATLRVPAAAFDRVIVSLGRGNIRVSDLTRSRVVAAGRVRLELRTARGRVEPPG